jgi:hypothetical protein
MARNEDRLKTVQSGDVIHLAGGYEIKVRKNGRKLYISPELNPVLDTSKRIPKADKRLTRKPPTV